MSEWKPPPENPYDSGFRPYEPPVGGPYGEQGAGNPHGHPYGNPYQTSAPTDGLSIAALVCSLTCCAAPVGIGLGIAGIVRTKDGRRSGRWAAITGLVVGVVLTLSMTAFLVFAGVMGARTVWEDEARVGQCINIDFLGDLAKGRCDEPHDAEVISVGRFDQDLLEEFDRLSTADFCAARELRPEHRAAVEDSTYDVRLSNDAFDEDDPDTGDWFVCYVERADGEELEGPVEG